MEYRKRMKRVAVLFCLGIATLVQANPKKNITLLLVPREETSVRLGLDLAARYPTLLVSYRLREGQPTSLHGWTGSQWVEITSKNYAAGQFFKMGPEAAILIHPETMSVPDDLIPSAEWCPQVYELSTDQIRPVLHLIGRYYGFDMKDWKWFAARYGQSVEGINPEQLNVHWFDKPMASLFEKSTNPEQAEADLQHWIVLRDSTPAETLSDSSEQDDALCGTNETSSVSGLECPTLSDELLTNSVSEAVVLGAPDVPEENAAVVVTNVVVKTVAETVRVEESTKITQVEEATEAPKVEDASETPNTEETP